VDNSERRFESIRSQVIGVLPHHLFVKTGSLKSNEKLETKKSNAFCRELGCFLTFDFELPFDLDALVEVNLFVEVDNLK
jgi:hypothetical protein